ncbi:hypothetical protein ACE1TI_04855 [Alteribacillus sp. JSM 102045]
MYQSYGFGYAEYNRSLEKRLEVEVSRELEHKISCQIAAEFQNRS